MVHHPPRSSNNNLRVLFKGSQLTVDGLAAVNRQNLDSPFIFGNIFKFVRGLNGQFPGRAKNQRLNKSQPGVGFSMTGIPKAQVLPVPVCA
jgi:hypothetical protein